MTSPAVEDGRVRKPSQSTTKAVLIVAPSGAGQAALAWPSALASERPGATRIKTATDPRASRTTGSRSLRHHALLRSATHAAPSIPMKPLALRLAKKNDSSG